MADDIKITASDIPDSIMQSQKLVGRHNFCHDIADCCDELKNYTPPEKDTSKTALSLSNPIKTEDSLLEKIVREHKYCHERVAEYPECANDFWEGELDSTLEPVDRAVFKISRAQARRAENDRYDKEKGNNLLSKLVAAFKEEED